jgi:hypothetical protein
MLMAEFQLPSGSGARFHRSLSLVGLLFRVGPMKDGPHTVRRDAHARAFALADFAAAGPEKSFDILPDDSGLNRGRKDGFKSRLVPSALDITFQYSL